MGRTKRLHVNEAKWKQKKTAWGKTISLHISPLTILAANLAIFHNNCKQQFANQSSEESPIIPFYAWLTSNKIALSLSLFAGKHFSLIVPRWTPRHLVYFFAKDAITELDYILEIIAVFLSSKKSRSYFFKFLHRLHSWSIIHIRYILGKSSIISYVSINFQLRFLYSKTHKTIYSHYFHIISRSTS